MRKAFNPSKDDGFIHIVPLSAIVVSGIHDLGNLAEVSFSTHSSAVTCMFATEYRQSEKDHLLLSGSSDGWVYMFDLEYVFRFDESMFSVLTNNLRIFVALERYLTHSAVIREK